MSDLFPLLLFLHVLGAIVALGPTFAFPLIGSMAAGEPAHGNFATRVAHRVGDRIVEPFVIVTAVTGIALIWSRNLPLFNPGFRWLLVSIVIYAAAMAFSLLVQRPTVVRLIELSGGPGAPGPELAATASRAGRNGRVLTVLTIAVVFLMVVKPSLGA